MDGDYTPAFAAGAGLRTAAIFLPQFIAGFAFFPPGAAIFSRLNVNRGSRLATAGNEEQEMKAQSTTVSGWSILADFGQTLAVGLAAGVFFALLSGMLVVIVSTVN
jgi:hypothetical protein